MDNRIRELLARLQQDASSENQLDAKEEEFQKIWDLSSRYKEQATPKFGVEKNLTQLKQRMQAEQQVAVKPTKIRRINILRIAAAIALLLVGTWVINNQFNPTDQWQWAENTSAAQMEIVLQDGSTVQLFPGSKLGYSKSFKGQPERAVSLNGKAHFDVEHNPAQPFIIETNDTRVKVLGTQFILSEATNQKETTVTVEEGRVAFTDKNTSKTVEVTVNEIGICQAGGVIYREATKVPDGPQIIQLRRETLARLVAQMSRRQSWNITLEEGLQTCEITGTFDVNAPSLTFAKLKELGYEVVRKVDGHYEIKGACQ